MLNNFLVKAKIATYASGGESSEKKLEDGCRELVFKKGNYVYRDRYYGFNPFIGEEIIWLDGEFVWGMNYSGRLIKDVDAKEVYSFLKKALRKIPLNAPYRGPERLEENSFRYENAWQEKNSFFHGVELIFFEGEKVYELYYHGFVLKAKQ